MSSDGAGLSDEVVVELNSPPADDAQPEPVPPEVSDEDPVPVES